MRRLPDADQLVRLINGKESPVIAETRRLRTALEASLVAIIRPLHEKDFELMTDLVFHRLGWQRITASMLTHAALPDLWPAQLDALQIAL
jgi:hypothetical protein